MSIENSCEATSTHLHGSQGRAAPQHRGHLARGQVRGLQPCSKGGQEVGHPKVGHAGVQWLRSINQQVGGPQVPVQDAQGVQVQQARHRLHQYGQHAGQPQAALEKGAYTGREGENVLLR